MGQCVHSTTPKPARSLRFDVLNVSPRGIAHLPGCDHKEDPDYTLWGQITIDPVAAWQALGNGREVASDGGGVPGLVAHRRCIPCVNR